MLHVDSIRRGQIVHAIDRCEWFFSMKFSVVPFVLLYDELYGCGSAVFDAFTSPILQNPFFTNWLSDKIL